MNYLALFESNDKNIDSEVSSLLKERNQKLLELEKFANNMETHHEILSYFFEANESSFRMKNFLNVEEAKKVLDGSFWQKLMNKIQVLDFMSAKERNQWHENISTRKCPEFSEEIVIPTIKNLLLSRKDFLARKVDGIFNALSGTHVTNNPSGFHSKMIFNLVGAYGIVDSRKCEFLNDLRSVIYQLLGRPKRSFHTYLDISKIQHNEDWGKWLEFDSSALRLKVYKRGTAHLEIHESIAYQLNQILAYLYPQAIPATRSKANKNIQKFELSNKTLQEDTLRKILDLRISKNNSVFIHEEDEEIKEVLKNLGGICFDRTWTFSYDPSKVIAEIVRLGYLPEKTSHQFYPTEEALADLAISHLGIYNDHYNLLEPSAGAGNLIESLKDYKNIKITCIEISNINSKVLAEKGYKVHNMDFLDYPVSNKFDRIIMNPPFNKNQAKIHLEKAIEHLEEDGVLVAILPASMKNYVNKKVKVECSDVISGAFKESGTEVSVVILSITK